MKMRCENDERKEKFGLELNLCGLVVVDVAVFIFFWRANQFMCQTISKRPQSEMNLGN